MKNMSPRLAFFDQDPSRRYGDFLEHFLDPAQFGLSATGEQPNSA